MSAMNYPLEAAENKNERCKEYEELLLKRDQLFRQCGSYMTGYTREFGDQLNANFEIKVECIKKKKTINYCRKQLNRGYAIDSARMQEEINQEMTLYYEQLKEMLRDTERAKKAGTISEYALSRAKKIYRRLTKILHPDINKRTMESETLRELWERISAAYQRTDVDELDDLEVLVRRAMEKLGNDGFELDLDDIEARIERIEKQINDILTTEPYTYGEMLRNDEKRQVFRDKLRAEHEEYALYLDSLNKTLEELLGDGGATFLWKMD